MATLWAISDLHVAHRGNESIVDQIRPSAPDDWLIVAGDVAARAAQEVEGDAEGQLVLELGAPLALADRRLGWLFAAGAFSMHWGIKVITRITFPYNLSGVLYLPLLLMPSPERR